MDKMFKRSLIGTAIATTMVATSANAAIDLVGDAVQLYGQAAGFIQYSTVDGGANSTNTIIESRVGLRGRVEFESFAPVLVWQIESGNADNDGFDPLTPWTHVNNGQFGARDTFLGLEFAGIGTIRYGRQLVAAYNYVDWPHTNPGLGNVFDWNNDIGVAFQDRANDVIRYDSPTWAGFNVQATLSGMATDTDQMVMNLAGSYTHDFFSVHAGYYRQNPYTVDDGTTITNAGDSQYYIVGGSLFLNEITLTAGYKMMENRAGDGSANASTISQDAYSVTAQYLLNNQYVFKVGYAGTTDSEGYTTGLAKRADGDTAITGRLGYLLPSAYLYADVRYYDMATETAANVTSKSKSTNFLLGMEYYF